MRLDLLDDLAGEIADRLPDRLLLLSVEFAQNLDHPLQATRGVEDVVKEDAFQDLPAFLVRDVMKGTNGEFFSLARKGRSGNAKVQRIRAHLSTDFQRGILAHLQYGPSGNS